MDTAIVRNEALGQEAVEHLQKKYSPSGKKIGWMMISSIFIEAWDLYSISFLLVFLSAEYHPSPLLLGLTAAGTQGGAIIGALTGGWLSDRLGRRAIFLGTMVMFIVLGVAQAFAPNMVVLAVVRFFLGVPLGSDLAAGYTYIMESMQPGKREVMGNRWQAMFGIGEVVSIGVITLLFATGINPDILWRVSLGLGAIPALVLLLLRLDLPETAIWLIQKGRFREAKALAGKMYDDRLEMLPDEDVEMHRPRLREFLTDIWQDDTKRRASVFSWIASWCQALEFSTFAFYIPVLFVLTGVSGIFATNLLSMGIYLVAVVSGLVGPQITPRIGQRKLSIWGFAIVLASLLAVAAALATHVLWLVPIAAAAMLWGHYWDAENVMTIPSMVAAPRQRGLATGFAYIQNKLPAFLGIFLFPSFFAAIGKTQATLFTGVFPLVGLLAAVFILPEVYGYMEKRRLP
ncbi:MFS transporter [Sinomonas sp.]|jgi:MFS family permease|uniref:MFS transporter n=1 Tax=Sinomonas sp. TaxID=1914986 RepID=UPI002FE0B824